MKTESSIDGVSVASLNRALARSHKDQFAGRDWQAAAVDAWNELDTQSEDVFTFLAESPSPYCDCSFCSTADWGMCRECGAEQGHYRICSHSED